MMERPVGSRKNERRYPQETMPISMDAARASKLKFPQYLYLSPEESKARVSVPTAEEPVSEPAEQYREPLLHGEVRAAEETADVSFDRPLPNDGQFDVVNEAAEMEDDAEYL